MLHSNGWLAAAAAAAASYTIPYFNHKSMRVDFGAGVVWVGMTVRAHAVVSDLGWVGF